MFILDEWLADLFWQVCTTIKAGCPYGSLDRLVNIKLDFGTDPKFPGVHEVPAEFIPLIFRAVPPALLLLAALPDHHLELFAQDRSLKFHPFAKLPTELRLKIWNLVLPESGHHRSLDGQLRKNGAYLYDRRPPRFEWPIGLFINRESRYETSKHYFVRELITSDGVVAVERFCMHPKKDIAYFDLFNLVARGRKSRGRKKLLEFFKQESDFAASIRVLEIRRVGYNHMFDEYFLDSIARDLLGQFKGLEEVRLMCSEIYHYATNWSVRNEMRFCVDDIQEFFMELKEKDPAGRTMPKVIATGFAEPS